MSEIRKKLESEILEADWSALAAHVERGVVISVSQELSLLDVAVSVANDDKPQVADWIQQGRLSKPTPQEKDALERRPDQRFRFVIVYPYVLVQKLAH